MPRVRVRGVANPMDFPDDMDKDDIREFLRRRFTQQAVSGTQPMDLGNKPETMQGVDESISQKITRGIGDTLLDKGLISNNQDAYRIGGNVGALAENIPFVGDLVDVDDFGKAAATGDKFGMLTSSLGAVPVIGGLAKTGALAIFGGVLAKSADLGALAKAKKLETGGVNRDEIWKETGWANDKGDWKFEIDDSQAEMMGIDYNEAITNAAMRGDSIEEIQALGKASADYTYPFREKGSRKLDDALGHSALYEAYPDARYIRQQSTSQHGLGEASYAPELDLISNSEMNAKAAKSPIIHELQHAIQSREGFAGGGSTATFDKKLESAKRLHPKYSQAAEIRGLLDEGVAIDDIPDIYKGMPEKDYVMSLLQDPDDLNLIKGFSLDELNSMAKSAKRDLDIDPFKQYERLAGEAEARNVQKRMDWTPEQRRATPPWASLDVPEDELIYRKGGGINQSSVLGGGGVKLGDASRINRAKEQGFIDDAFHGTSKDFEAFDSSQVDIGTHVGTTEQANERLKSVHREKSGASEFTSGELVGSGDNIIPVKVKLGRSLEMDDVGTWNNSESVLAALDDIPEFRGKLDGIWDELGVVDDFSDVQDWVKSPQNRKVLDAANEMLRDAGYDSIRYKNAVENKYGGLADAKYSKADSAALKLKQGRIKEINTNQSKANQLPSDEEIAADPSVLDDWLSGKSEKKMSENNATEIRKLKADIEAIRKRDISDPYSSIILNPANIRSKFAKFDPKNVGKAGLLGAGAGAAILTGTGEDDKRKPD